MISSRANMELVVRVVFTLTVLVAVAVLPDVQAATYTTEDIVDLTSPLKTNESMYWLGWPYSYIQSNLLNLSLSDGQWAEANAFKMSIHTGTHLDAPCHYSHRLPGKGQQRLHEVPITRFFGPAAVIDVKAKVDEDDDYQLTVDDVTAWEASNGLVPDGAIVLVHTGWAKRYNTDLEKYWGTTNESETQLFSYPGVLPETASYLVEDRNINAIGIDAGSPEGGRTVRGVGGNPVHIIFLDNNRLILENVAPELEKMPPTGYRIHAVPLNLHDVCGSPIRLLAFKNPETSAAGRHVVGTGSLLALLFLLLQ